MNKSSLTVDLNRHGSYESHRLAVIGGGPGAISFCMQLFAKLKHVVPNNTKCSFLKVLIFEKTSKVGPGLAYSGSENAQIINHPKDNMEPVAHANGQFTKWLGENHEGDYPPRHLYGKYMEHLAGELQLEADNHPYISLTYVLDTCITNIVPNKSKFSIHSETQMWEVETVVLSTGHLPTDSYREFIGQPGYAADEYANKLNYATLKGDEDIGIIGSRLTALDIALKLQASGHRGRLIMASRNGVLPAVFSPLDVRLQNNLKTECRVKYLGTRDSVVAKPVLVDLVHQFMSEVSKLQGCECSIEEAEDYFRSVKPLDWLNDQIKSAELGAKPWQLVLFSLNPLLAKLWSGLSLEDKADFFSRFYSMLMTYYAAMPLQSAYKLRDMVKSGQLLVMRNVQPVKYQNGLYSLRNGEGLHFQIKYLFNAMGPGYSAANVPLYAALIAGGLVTPHPFGGINVDENTLQVVNKAGDVVEGMFAIGELTKGTFLITTVLSKIAEQANKMPSLADVIVSLTQDGWIVNSEKTVELIGEKLSTSNTSSKEVISLLLDEDIKDFGHPALQDHLDKKTSMLTGPIVVQLARWKNVSYPKIAEHLNNDGLCKLSLTDGFSTLEGLQLDQPLNQIDGNTPAGVKILLKGKILYEGGYLILDPSNCRLLGGNVEKLVEKWVAAKLSMKKDGNTVATDYPKFEPFQKQKSNYNKPSIEANLGSLTINSSAQDCAREISEAPKEKNRPKKNPKPRRGENHSREHNQRVNAPYQSEMSRNEYTSIGQTSSSINASNQFSSRSHHGHEERRGGHVNNNTRPRGSRGTSRGSTNRPPRQNLNDGSFGNARYDHRPPNHQDGYGENFGTNSARSDRQFSNNSGRSHAFSNTSYQNRSNARPATMPVYNTTNQEEFPALGGQPTPLVRPNAPVFSNTTKTFYRSRQ
uniref:RecQ mediated genome instability protein 1-like N-terminal helical domain-containing protein n=1 Tax=Ditylenchus dipsaci TaxID=166011 RepID=A0A915CN02_9BILA